MVEISSCDYHELRVVRTLYGLEGVIRFGRRIRVGVLEVGWREEDMTFGLDGLDG